MEYGAARLGLDAEELFAHGKSGDFGAAVGKEAAVSGKETSARATKRPMDAIGESGDGVGLHHDHRNAAEHGGDNRRSGHVAAHAEDGGRVADGTIAADGGDRQAAQRGEVLSQADAVEPADFDFF